ncbi:hypothetical protein B296_00000102 [Ensete ventricosum]|uniref:Uncharacterized protein n=1 Tax=Ensete ventricosum TaxID=4639 RepID=A0A426ZP96_ENSVE|nr:hypothetical protein B296_00000102 [Ensete ventricosum]
MDSMPILPLEELNLLAVTDSGVEVIHREDFRQRGPLLEEVMECQHKPLTDLSQYSSLVNSFGWEGRLIVDGVEGLYAANRVVTLVLRASWFSLSSCSRAKEIAIVIV